MKNDKVITFALAYLGSGSGTGGMVYNWHLAEAWSRKAIIRKCDVKKRFFQLGAAGPAWLLQHGSILRNTDILVQAASSGYHSGLIIDFSRRFFPNIKHIGIAHHPRWLENSDLVVEEVKYYNKFDRLITTANHVRNEMISKGVTAEIDILMPGYNPPDGPVIKSNKHDTKILWNGHLIERKGAHIVAKALDGLNVGSWKSTFLSVSEPDQLYKKRFLEIHDKLAEKSGNRSTYITRLPFRDYLKILAENDFYCLPSSVEGSSVAFVEAIAYGCIVIVPKTQTFCETLGSNDYPGFFEPDSSKSLRTTLEALIRDQSLQQEARLYLQKRLSHIPTWDKFKNNCEQYLDIL